MNVREVRAELNKINDLLDNGVNGESVRAPYHYITPDRYDSRDDREADTNRSADCDLDWLRETLGECLELLGENYFESLLMKEELLMALEEKGVKDWDGYKKAHEEVFGFPEDLKFDDFVSGQVIKGRVRMIKPYGVFVSIAPTIDALCPVPEEVKIEEGMNVMYKIGTVDKENNKIKGRILRID